MQKGAGSVPLLRYRATPLLCAVRYRATRLLCARLHVVLRVRYALSGTEIAYGPTRGSGTASLRSLNFRRVPPMALGSRYPMSGANVGYATTCSALTWDVPLLLTWDVPLTWDMPCYQGLRASARGRHVLLISDFLPTELQNERVRAQTLLNH
eukprot:578513-Rhodomonas_salina.1